MKCVGRMAPMGERRGTYRVLMGKLEVKKPLERSRRGWKYDIKIYLEEVGWESVDWTNVAEVLDD